MKPPSKWHLARVGLLTALLGLGAGWMLTYQPPPPTVIVPDAKQIALVCQGLTLKAEGERVQVASTLRCQVDALFPDGAASTGSRVSVSGLLRCTRSLEVLRCEPSSL